MSGACHDPAPARVEGLRRRAGPGPGPHRRLLQRRQGRVRRPARRQRSGQDARSSGCSTGDERPSEGEIEVAGFDVVDAAPPRDPAAPPVASASSSRTPSCSPGAPCSRTSRSCCACSARRAARSRRSRSARSRRSASPRAPRRYPHQLSQGEAQRAALARAIVKSPAAAPRRRAHGQPRRRHGRRDPRPDQGHLDPRHHRAPRDASGAAGGPAQAPHPQAGARPPREGRGLSVASFLVSEALRDLRRAGRVGVSAVLLIALSLAALGGFWLLSLNLGRAIGQWRERVRVVVYLQEEPPAANGRRPRWPGSRRSAASSACATCPRTRRSHRSSARSAARPTWWTSSRGTRCPPPSR